MSTITNIDTYVNGHKVISSTDTTITLDNGVTVEKSKCTFLCVDVVAGATYYRYQD